MIFLRIILGLVSIGIGIGIFYYSAKLKKTDRKELAKGTNVSGGDSIIGFIIVFVIMSLISFLLLVLPIRVTKAILFLFAIIMMILGGVVILGY